MKATTAPVIKSLAKLALTGLKEITREIDIENSLVVK
jgi:hypothetical protein